MELEPGFKLSEAGQIPEDWKAVTVGDVAPLQRGFDLPYRSLRPGNVPVVASNGVIAYHDVGPVKGPGLVTGRSGTIGTVHFVVSEAYWPHNTALWVTNFKDNDPKYISYLFKALPLQDLANGSGVPTLDRKDVHEIAIALPSPGEQKIIAASLGEVDCWIAEAEAEAAKLASVRVATMDALLTPTIRLRNSSGDWDLSCIGETAIVMQGGTPSTAVPAFWNGNIPWCTPTDITAIEGNELTRTERTISEAGLRSCAGALLPAGTILLCTRATIGEAKIAAVKVATNQGFRPLIARPGVDPLFLYYSILALKPLLIERASGSTFLEISKADVEATPMRLPTVSEQQAIAAILSDIDAALAVARAVVAKARGVKAAAMDALLSGRVRLPSFGRAVRRAPSDVEVTA